MEISQQPFSPDTPRTSVRQDKLATFFVVLVVLLLGSGLTLAGYPIANHPDEPFFVGAAVHFSETGELANPMIEGWIKKQFGTERYYVQLPGQTITLGYWLKFFGVCIPSVLGYHWFCVLLGSVFFALYLTRFSLTVVQILLIQAIWLFHNLDNAGRPEVPGFTFLFAGLSILANTQLRVFFAFLCFGFGVLCYPIIVAFAFPLTALQILFAKRLGAWYGVSVWNVPVPTLLAAACAFFALYGAVRGDLYEFLRVFSEHKRLRAGDGGIRGIVSNFISFVNISSTGRYRLTLGIVLFANLAVTAAAIRKHVRAELPLLPMLAIVLGVFFASGLYASAAIAIAPTFLSLATIAGVNGKLVARGALYVLVVFGFLATKTTVIARIVLQDRTTHRLDSHAGDLIATCKASGCKILVDGNVYRHVFYFKNPLQAKCLLYEALHPEAPLTRNVPNQDELWIVSNNTCFIAGLSKFDRNEFVQIGGYRSKSVLMFPYHYQILSTKQAER